MSLRFKTSMACLLCASFLLVVSSPVWSEDAANPIVSKVDGKEITQQDVLSEIDDMVKMAGNQVNPAMIPQLKGQLYSRALGNIQEKMLLKKVADEKKMVVEPKEIDDRYAELLSKFPNEDEFKKRLEQSGLTPETLKKRMQEDMIYGKVLDSEVKSATPTDEEVGKYFTENKDKMKQEEQVTASHILINAKKTDSDDVKAKAKEKLEGIRKDIVAKKVTFADAAKQNSDCPSKARGGDLGSFGKGQMVPEFEQVAFALKPGDISDVFQTDFGFHIVQVSEHKQAKELTLDETKEEIGDMLMQQKLQADRQAYIKKLRDSAKIETLIDEAAWKAKFAPKKEEKPKDGAVQISPENLKP